jgi:hypothetical protein
LADLPGEIAARFHDWHKRAIDCFAGVSEEASAWRPDSGPQSLLWQLWHVARWDDRFAWIIADRAPGLRRGVPQHEIWLRDSVAAKWGWPADLKLGRGNAGTGLSAEQNAALVFPGIQQVVDYARAAFQHVEFAVASLDPATLGEIPPRATDTDSWATNALMYLEHLPEHIAVMEVLRSLQGLSQLPDG